MTRTISEHLLRLTGDNSGFVRAADGSSSAIKRLDESSRRGQASLDRYNSSLQVSTRATTAFARAFGGITIGLVAREFVQAADSMTLLEGRLKLVTDGTNDLISTQQNLFSVAQDSRASLEATTSFYVRLAQRLGEATTGSLELSEITELVSKSLKIGGATAKETTSSLLQLSQALSSGLLRGDEFRSLSENAVGLMQNIADGANLTQAELRALSIEGKLTTELILDALANSAPEIRRQFNEIPVTFGDAVQRLQNIAVQGVADFNQEFKVTDKLVETVEFLGNNIEGLTQLFTALVAVKVGRSIAETTAAMRASSAAAQAQSAALISAERATVRKALADAGASRAARDDLIIQQQRTRALISAGGPQARLIELKKADAVLTTSLARANTRLLTSDVALAQAKRQLAAATATTTTVMSRLGSVVGVLGGPVGIALLATQLAFMFDVFGDGNEQIELTTRSFEELSNKTQELTELGFEDLTLRKQQIEEEIAWRSAIDSTIEGNQQKLGIAQELLKVTEEELAQTREGQELALEDLRNQKAALAAEEQRLSSRARLNSSIIGLTANQNELVAVQRELKIIEDQLTVAARERQAASDDSLVAFVSTLSAETEGAQIRRKLIEGLEDEASKITAKRVELERLKTLQQETNNNDSLSAEGKKVLAEQIKKLTEQIEGRTKKSKNQLDIVEQLEKKESDLRAEIEKLTSAHQASGEQVSIFSVALESKRKELEKHLGIIPDVSAKVEELTAKYISGEITVKEYEKALKQLKLTQQEVEAVLRESGATYDKAEAALKKLNQAQQDQLEIQRIAATEGEVAAEVYRELAKVADDYGLTVEELKEKYPELIEKQAEFIEQREGLEEVNKAIEDFSTSLADAIVEGENLGDFFKELWKKMVKDFIASGITKLIGSLISGNGFDFSGFTVGGGGGGTGGALLGGLLNGGRGGTSPNGSGGLIQQGGQALGLTADQTTAVIDGAGAVLSLYNGYQQITNGNEIGGALQIANGGVRGYNAFQSFTGGQQLGGNIVGGLGVAGGLYGIYGGIRQGGLEGYGSAAISAYQTYASLQALGFLGGGVAGAGAGTIGAGVLGSGVGGAGVGATLTGGGGAAITGGGLGAGAGGGSGAAAGALGTTGAVLGYVAIAAALDQVLLDGKIGDAGFRADRAKYEDIKNGGFGGLAKALNRDFTGDTLRTFVGGLIGRGARSYEEILQEDRLPELLGINAGSAFGANGGLGFNGGNAGIFGANFGIRGSGLTAQFLANGGENGNGGFFTGAQSSLDGFEEALREAGFDGLINNTAGTLRVFDEEKTIEDIMAVWRTYSEGLEENVAASEVFRTAVENGLLGHESHAKLFFENFAVGFGQSAFEARDSLLLIDSRFDELRDNGIAATDALFQSIGEHYGIAVEDAQFFVEQTGVSVDQWVENFTNASDQNLAALLEFNGDGVTAFEDALRTMDAASSDMSASVSEDFQGIAGTAAEQARRAADAFGGSFDTITDGSELAIDSIGADFSSLTDKIQQQGTDAANAYKESLRSLEGTLNGVNLGTPRAGKASISVESGGNIRDLGQFNSALSGSETVTPGGFGLGSTLDKQYTLGMNDQESLTVNRKGMIERIERKIDQLDNQSRGESSNGDIKKLLQEVRKQNKYLGALVRER